MFNRNDEYINATKDARINTYDNRGTSVGVWFLNFSLFSVLLIGSYYLYLYYNNTKNHHATIVMGVSHTRTSDNDLMVKLDEVTVDRDEISISDAMKKIVDNSLVEDNSKYVEELVVEADKGLEEKNKKLAFEKRVSDELKLIN